MPEEFEQNDDPIIEEVASPDAVLEGSEVEAKEPEAQADHKIPYDRFREVNEAKARAEAELHQHRMMLLQMQQAQMAQAQQRQPEPQVDPDVEALIAPVIKKSLAPYEQEIQRLNRVNTELAAKAEAEAAWDYVTRAVPDIEDLRGDILSYVGQLAPAMQKKITSDPDQVILVANMVRAQKAAGGAEVSSAARQSMKSRTRASVGSSSVTPTTNANVDWESMDSKTFRETIAKMGIKL